MRIDQNSIAKILVLRYRSIGDILLANPSLEAIRAKFPKASIHMLVDDLFAELLRNNPNVDKVITSQRVVGKRGVRAEWAEIKKLRAEKYDMVIDLQGGPRGAVTALMSGARIRVGHRFRLRNRICYNLYAETPEPDEHSWRVQFRTVRALGAQWPDSPRFLLEVTQTDTASVSQKLEDAGLMFDRPIVVLHPGGRVPVKKWPSAKMGQLAKWLADDMGMAVVLAGSEKDAEDIQIIRRASGYALPWFTDLSLGELSVLLASAVLVVCNDSGPMHMAGVLDVPTVALFGPSDPSLWAPVGDRKKILTCAPMECMPCDQKNCPRQGDHCITRIEVNEVKSAIKRLMTKT